MVGAGCYAHLPTPSRFEERGGGAVRAISGGSVCIERA